ncbi:MAG: S-methyl-5'-thioinosine phosphorylase [Wenzhouxiangella sp.]|nr:S-methyl-5'-thioinosine phosphorylase [Wenzhouxiangella sp.]
MSGALGIIAGTGALGLFEILEERALETAWGKPSAAVARVRLGAGSCWMLARHGRPHRIPPHRVDYRANIAALAELGVDRVVAINAVGSVDPTLAPGALVLPDQLIDYTWGRAHSFSDSADHPLEHIEFGEPFSGSLRFALAAAATRAGVEIRAEGCYGVTQGPRLETAAEIVRLGRDGCTLVGMTAMPEAALAREAGLEYASLCVVANPAAGLAENPISIDEIHAVLAQAMDRVGKVLTALVHELEGQA